MVEYCLWEVSSDTSLTCLAIPVLTHLDSRMTILRGFLEGLPLGVKVRAGSLKGC